MKKAVLAAAVLAVAICATVVWSQAGRGPGGSGGPGPGGPGPGGPGGPGRQGGPAPGVMAAVMPPPPGVFEREAETLGLTDEQLAQLADAMKTTEETVRPLMKKVGDACKALREALTAAHYDAQNVAQLAEAAENAEAAVVSARIDQWTKIRSILNADQITKLKELMSAQRPGPPGPPPAGPPPEK